MSVALGFQLRNPSFPRGAHHLRMLLNHTSSLRDDAGYYWTNCAKGAMRDVLTPRGKAVWPGALCGTAATRRVPISSIAIWPGAWSGTVMERDR